MGWAPRRARLHPGGGRARQNHGVGAALVGLFAQLFQTVGGVHGVADDGVVDAARCADVADDHLAAVDADADAYRIAALAHPRRVVGGHRGANGQRGAAGARGMVGLGLGRL